MPGVHAFSPTLALQRLLIGLAHLTLHVRGPWIGITLSLWIAAVGLANVPKVRRYNPKVWFWLMHLLWMIPLSIGIVDGMPVFIGILHPALHHPLIWPKGQGGVA